MKRSVRLPPERCHHAARLTAGSAPAARQRPGGRL